MGAKVPAERINQLMTGVTYHVYRVPDTTTTVAVAYSEDGFRLSVGASDCVDPANYDFELGKKYACERAEYDARNKLWELEGYHLFQSLKESSSNE